MSEYFYLIPLSLVLGLAGLGVFLWTLKAGQYEDLRGAAERILFEDEAPAHTGTAAGEQKRQVL